MIVSFGELFANATLFVKSRISDLFVPILDLTTDPLSCPSYLLKATCVNPPKTLPFVSYIKITMFGILSINSWGFVGCNLSNLKISFVFLMASFFILLISSNKNDLFY